MLSRRRRRRLPDPPRDDREIVIVGDQAFTCDQFKLGAEVRMARCDELPAAYRALCNDFNLHAGDVAALMKKRKTPDDIRRMVEAKLGPPI